MRYPPEQIDRLAGEYAIGTLHGRARRRFESLMRQRADVRYSVWQWEKMLYALATGVEPVPPPRSVWPQIRRRIKRRDVSRVSWRWPRFASATAAVAAIAFWLGSTSQLSAPSQIAIFSDESAQVLWVVNADAKDRLSVEAAGISPALGDQVYQLWALPDGLNPVSLGVLSVESGTREAPLTAAMVAALNQSAALAISIEPAGGSPTGLPTGPVVYQASLVRL